MEFEVDSHKGSRLNRVELNSRVDFFFFSSSTRRGSELKGWLKGRVGKVGIELEDLSRR